MTGINPMKVIIASIFIGLGALFGQEDAPQASIIYWNSAFAV